jgi:hypothetical protein
MSSMADHMQPYRELLAWGIKNLFLRGKAASKAAAQAIRASIHLNLPQIQFTNARLE